MALKRWWLALTERERRLIAAGAAVTVFLVGWQGLVAPISEYRASAEAEWRTALSQADEARRLARRIRSLTAVTNERDSAIDVRTAAAAAARDNNVSIARLQPMADGGLEVWIEDAEASDVIRWISLLRERHAIGVARASIARRDSDAGIRAQVVLSPPGES